MQSLDQHVHHADVIGDHLLAAGHTIDSRLEPLHNDDAKGVKGLMYDLASSYGNGATSNPFVGAPMGLVGANEPVPSEAIPQLAASIASMPSSDDHHLDTNRIYEGTKSGNAFAMTAIDKYLEMNPTNFGHAGSGVVTGNLGGSLGLGGIGGIDGGNALTVNETIKTKRNFHPLGSRRLPLDGRKHYKSNSKNKVKERKFHFGRPQIDKNIKIKNLFEKSRVVIQQGKFNEHKLHSSKRTLDNNLHKRSYSNSKQLGIQTRKTTHQVRYQIKMNNKRKHLHKRQHFFKSSKSSISAKGA